MHKQFRHLCLALAALIAAGTLLAALIPAAEAATYKKGSSGAVVSQIQTKLKNWGYYAGDVDGIYGSATERAVRAFQRKNGLTADGKAGAQTLEALGLPAHSAAFELNLTALFGTLDGKPVQAKPIATFPPVKQDLAFTVDQSVTAAQLEAVVREAAGANLESIELFDVFTGEQVGEGKKSLAYAVVFRSPSKTLSAEDSDAIRKAIVAEAAEIGAQLRA